MKYTLEVQTTVQADPSALWQAWTDMQRFSSWDPREEETHLEGPFQVGAIGWSKQKGTPRSPITITAVTQGKRWQVQTPLPGGNLMIDHEMRRLDGGRIQLVKRYEAHGPTALAFRLYYARKIRREMPDSFAALCAEATRLHAAATA